MMSQKHSKNRKKKKKKSPAEKRKAVAELLETLVNINLAITCLLCDKNDCVNKFKCQSYKSTGNQFSEDFKEVEKMLDEEEQG